MKTWKIFSFEFSYLVRRVSTWMYLAVLLLFTLLMNWITTPGDGVYANNNFHIIGITVIGGLIWLVMGAAIAGEAAARDVKMRMHNLIYSTPISKLDYLAGRFLAALAVNAMLVLALPLGVLVSFYLPGMEEEPLQPFQLWPYFNVYFLVALPNAFIATAVQFSLSALSRQVMTSYLASLLLAIVAQVLAIAIAKLLGNWDLVKLLDPVGVAGIMGNELATWTPSEKNTRLLTLDGMFLWNRVLWISIALGSLVLTYTGFNFGNVVTKNWWKRFRKSTSEAGKTIPASPTIKTAIIVPQVQQSFGIATYFNQTRSIAWASFKKIARHPIGLTLVGSIALVSAIFGNRIMTQFGIPLLPTTQQVLSYLSTPIGNLRSPWVVIPLLIIYFMGELLWHERDAGVSDIVDATPVPDWILMAGKFLGLGLIIFVWMAILLASGIGMQISLGYNTFEIGLYLQSLFGLQFIEYLLFAMLALVVHVVVNQKYIGYLLMVLAFSFLAFPSSFGVEHKMLIFGAEAGWMYSDMRGFAETLTPWLLFKLYWTAWALLLAVVARLLWARGREQRLKHLLQLAKFGFTKSTRWMTVIAIGLIVLVGSVIFYNTNVLNKYNSNADINDRKAEYERRYGEYRNSPQPELAATKLRVEIYPDRQRVEIRAGYTLVNRHTASIDSIHIGNVSCIAFAEVKFDRSAVAVRIDESLSHHIYALKQPLLPGDSLQLNFVVHYQQKGFQQDGGNVLVVKNGTHFSNFDLLPSIGYQRNRELNDGVTRKRYKLAARPAIPSLYDAVARQKPLLADQNRFDAIIGTAKDEVAVAPGHLLRTWTAGNRRYFHFKTDGAISGEYSILSAKYALKEIKWQDVAIRIYHHPGHTQNTDRILRSATASMEFYSAQFGPYPYNHLTIVEQAGPGGGASSEASMINYGEQFALMNPDDSPAGFDLPYYILAHEVAHQWFGGAGLKPANVEGAGVLIEGLAVYAGMQVFQKTYGEAHLRKYLAYLHSFYEMPRSLATPSLLQANESFLYYRKGGLAMYTLSKFIGKEKMNAALRGLLQKHHSGELTLPTTLDLYNEIQNVVPDSLNYLLTDLFKENMYWRLKSEKLVASQNKAGNWEVTLNVRAQKFVVDSAGRELEMPMNDLLELGFYEDVNGFSKPIYLQMHRIRSGAQTIKVTLPRKPTSGGIDPNFLMIDIRVDDNVIELAE